LQLGTCVLRLVIRGDFKGGEENEQTPDWVCGGTWDVKEDANGYIRRGGIYDGTCMRNELEGLFHETRGWDGLGELGGGKDE